VTNENKRDNARIELSAAADERDVARLLWQQGHAKQSVGRAYYAVFHTARALLMAEGLQSKTHSGVAYLIQTHFIHSQRIPARFSATLARLQGRREMSDYDAAAVFTLEQAEEALQEAEDFDTAARLWLRADDYEA
jgi:hypothetical protein